MKISLASDASKESVGFCWYRWGARPGSLRGELVETLQARSLPGAQAAFAAGVILSAVGNLTVGDLQDPSKFRPIKLSGSELIELRADAGLPRQPGTQGWRPGDVYQKRRHLHDQGS